MNNAHQVTAWDHTAAICATVINMHRDPRRSRAVDVVKLNPFRTQVAAVPKIQLDKNASMKVLKQVFVDHRMPTMVEMASGKL